MNILIENARVFLGSAASGKSPRADGGSADLCNVAVAGGLIESITPSTVAAPRPPLPVSVTRINAGGRVLFPGFVDCHTHACWFDEHGDHRLDEWDQKRAGTPYLEILRAGGGIMASVRAVRNATQEQLAEQLLTRLMLMLRTGTTTVEVKSGYGLSTEHEIKMLRAVNIARGHFPGTIVPTALLGHALDPDVDREAFVRRTIEETLPAVHEQFGPSIAIDAYCEQGAWSLEECRRLFEAAIDLGHPVRVHADQFSSTGMVPLAISLGARSVDHLEASTADHLAALGRSSTIGVALPACGLHLDDRYANLAALGDGTPCCIATNLNPGSAPCSSMPLVIALATRKNRLSPGHATDAATVHPARLLGFSDRGTIRVGARADLVLFDMLDARAIAFQMAQQPRVVIVAGKVVNGL